MWATGGHGASTRPRGSQKFWDQLPQDKYAARYPGEHFDYLPESDTGNAPRGECQKVGSVAADLVALFIASNLFSLTPIAVDLKPPQVQLTPEQEFFAGTHLEGEGAFQGGPGCTSNIRWNVGGNVGSRHLGV